MDRDIAVQGPADPVDAKEDISGRNRFGRNIAFTWVAYLANTIVGFVLPRLVGSYLGQTTLGVWDFAWGMVTYFGFVQLGLSGAMVRYVSRYRASRDYYALSQSVSTINLFMKVAAAVCLILTLLTVGWVIPCFRDKLGSDLRVAQVVVLLLGVELTTSTFCAGYIGIIGGCHRWDIYYGITVATFICSSLAMVITLLAGGGLAMLALMHLLGSATNDIIQAVVARHICRELIIDYRKASWSVFQEQLRFSGKTLLPRVAMLVSNQCVSLLVTLFLGVAPLAVLSRPRSLVAQFQAVVAKLAHVVSPIASSLHATSDHEALRRTSLRLTGALSVTLMPATIGLAIFGDWVVHFWMGKHYVHPGLTAVLALMAFPAVVQEPLWSVLSGTNQHGRAGLARLVAALVSAALLFLALKFWKANLLSVAVIGGGPDALVTGILVPMLASRFVGFSLGEFYWNTYFRPLLWCIPSTSCFLAARLCANKSVLCSILLVVSGIALVAMTYWMMLLPTKLKRQVTDLLNPRRQLLSGPSTPT